MDQRHKWTSSEQTKNTQKNFYNPNFVLLEYELEKRNLENLLLVLLREAE